MANELRQEIGGGALEGPTGRERILGNSERIKGDAGRDAERDLREVLEEMLRRPKGRSAPGLKEKSLTMWKT